MRIIQILPTLSYGDAIGNDTLALYNTLKRAGYRTSIYAEAIDRRIKKYAKPINKIPRLNSNDIIIYHFSIGSQLNFELEKLNGHKIIIYHNITPPDYFIDYSMEAYKMCKYGYEGVNHLKDIAEYVIAVSEYNKQDLIKAGYQCDIDVLPILIPFSDYDKEPDKAIINKYSDSYTNILFTGRIAPNKKHEDIIAAFYMYQKYYNSKSRLFLVGGGMEVYEKSVKQYANQLGLKNVYFTGHIKFNEILAYYKIADIFLCMSEHEGFCVPLVEAMHFDIPIIARNTSAIPYTLDHAGVLLDSNDPLEAAGMIDYIQNHKEIKDEIIKNQRKRLQAFGHDRIEKQFLNYLSSFIEKNNVK